MHFAVIPVSFMEILKSKHLGMHFAVIPGRRPIWWFQRLQNKWTSSKPELRILTLSHSIWHNSQCERNKQKQNWIVSIVAVFLDKRDRLSTLSTAGALTSCICVWNKIKQKIDIPTSDSYFYIFLKNAKHEGFSVAPESVCFSYNIPFYWPPNPGLLS